MYFIDNQFVTIPSIVRRNQEKLVKGACTERPSIRRSVASLLIPNNRILSSAQRLPQGIPTNRILSSAQRVAKGRFVGAWSTGALRYAALRLLRTPARWRPSIRRSAATQDACTERPSIRRSAATQDACTGRLRLLRTPVWHLLAHRTKDCLAQDLVAQTVGVAVGGVGAPALD